MLGRPPLFPGVKEPPAAEWPGGAGFLRTKVFRVGRPTSQGELRALRAWIPTLPLRGQPPTRGSTLMGELMPGTNGEGFLVAKDMGIGRG